MSVAAAASSTRLVFDGDRDVDLEQQAITVSVTDASGRANSTQRPVVQDSTPPTLAAPLALTSPTRTSELRITIAGTVCGIDNKDMAGQNNCIGTGAASYHPSCATSTTAPTSHTAPTTNVRPA